jgi:hypothetical protein
MNILQCASCGAFPAHLKMCPDCGVAGVAEAHEGKPAKKRKKAERVELSDWKPIGAEKVRIQERWGLKLGGKVIVEATLEETIDYQMRKWK